MLKKFGEEKLNFQLRQHFVTAVAAFNEHWNGAVAEPDKMLDHFFGELSRRSVEDSENFRVRLIPRRFDHPKARGAALMISLYEPELRFQKGILFRARASLNRAATEEGNLFDSDNIKEEAAEILGISQSACFTTFSPQGIHVLSASSIVGDHASDAYLLKNFYYLNIADFIGNLFFKCFVGDTRPLFIQGLQAGEWCRNLLEIRITVTPQLAQQPLF
ncbi:MAG TPA: hypothetical protein VGK99_02360 [Acidobacteriota bacterium]|jgi:hypothetical protein